MNTLERDTSIFSHDIENLDAGIEGLMCKPEERHRVENYLRLQQRSGYINGLIGETESIAVLKSVWVEEEEQGNGLGTELVESFLDEASDRGMDRIILIADTEDDNEFNLVEWYESFGFEKITSLKEFPLMMKTVNA